jgi:hypothetical protein
MSGVDLLTDDLSKLDLAGLEDLTVEELFSPTAKGDAEAPAIFCDCCCTSCGC